MNYFEDWRVPPCSTHPVKNDPQASLMSRLTCQRLRKAHRHHLLKQLLLQFGWHSWPRDESRHSTEAEEPLDFTGIAVGAPGGNT